MRFMWRTFCKQSSKKGKILIYRIQNKKNIYKISNQWVNVFYKIFLFYLNKELKIREMKKILSQNSENKLKNISLKDWKPVSSQPKIYTGKITYSMNNKDLNKSE